MNVKPKNKITMLVNSRIVVQAICSCREIDHKAVDFYSEFRTDSGSRLSEKNVHSLSTKATLLNIANDTICNGIHFGDQVRKVTLRDIADGIRYLNECEYDSVKLPENSKRLGQLLKLYRQYGYAALIHKNFGNRNALKSK